MEGVDMSLLNGIDIHTGTEFDDASEQFRVRCIFREK